jgi:hypothetical protein
MDERLPPIRIERRHPVKRPFWSVSPFYAKIILISFIVLSFGLYYVFFLVEDRLENFPYNYHSMVYPGYRYLLKPLKKTEAPAPPEVPIVQPQAEKPVRTSLLEREVEQALYRFEKNRVILSNFTALEINRNDKNSGDISGYGGICEVEVLADRQHPDGFLRITYKVSLPESYAGFSGKLKGLDLTNYKKLSFDVKGKSGNEVFSVALADSPGGKKAKVSITSFLPDGLSSEWRKVTIPLKEFDAFSQKKNIDGSLSFLFENSQGTPYDGEVSFKDVALEK